MSSSDGLAEPSGFRAPSAREKALVATMLRVEFPGRDALVRQLENASVKTIDPDGSLKFSVGTSERADVLQRVPVHAQAIDLDGMTIQLLVHVLDGLLDEFEVFRDDSRPLQHSIGPDELEVFVLPL